MKTVKRQQHLEGVWLGQKHAQENKWNELGLNNITDIPSFEFHIGSQIPSHPNTLRNSRNTSGTGGN